MIKFITKTIEYVFLALLMVVLLAMGVSVAEKVFNGALAVIVGLFILMVVFAVLFLFRKKTEAMCRRAYTYLYEIPSWKLALALGLFSAITKTIFVFVFNNNADLHPDMAMYRSFAEQYAQIGHIIDNAGYAIRYPYTAIYGLILSPFAKLFGGDTKVFTVALSILHSVAMVLLYDILKRYCGKEISFFALLLYCASPMGLLQTQLLIHENGLLFLHILSLWIFLKALEYKSNIFKQVSLVFLASLILCIGKTINASGRVLVISFGIYAFIKIFENGFDTKKLLKFVCVVVSLLLCYTITSRATSVIVDRTVEGVDETQFEGFSLPYGWGIYLGSNYEHSGGWNEEDRDTYELYKQFDSKEEAHEYQRALISERLDFYKRSPIKILIHLFNKTKVLWDTFLPFKYEQGNSINHFVLYGLGGIVYKVCKIFNQGLFLIVYTTVFLAKIKRIKLKTPIEVIPDLHFQMAIIGVTLALLLLAEVTAKYASHLHILFFCIFALSAKTLLTSNETASADDSNR